MKPIKDRNGANEIRNKGDPDEGAVWTVVKDEEGVKSETWASVDRACQY